MDTAAILRAQDHRPRPLPRSPWIMQQSWKDLLFLHYRVPPDILRDKVPRSLELDLLNGDAWVTVTPMKMRQVRLRWLPPIPTATNFLELNFRTYVRHKGEPGIYFFSLDTDSSLSALGARMSFLPYYRARMSVSGATRFSFRSERMVGSGLPAFFEADYAPGEKITDKSTLDAWLLERYRLFQAGIAGLVIAIDIHHLPWALRQVDATVRANTLAAPLGFALPVQEPVMHYSDGMDVVIFPPVPA
jgi:uncharacterized protein